MTIEVDSVAPKFMTTKEVAREFGIAESSVYQLARRGDLPFSIIKFGRTVRFRRSEVEAFIRGDQ